MPHKDKTEYNQYLNTYMKDRWARRRSAALDFLGGHCVVCGTSELLEFDHIDPATKLMSIARASSRSEVFFWAEVKKCQLLCKAHHLEKTNADRE